jgi:excisionase family DNA binding protein
MRKVDSTSPPGPEISFDRFFSGLNEKLTEVLKKLDNLATQGQSEELYTIDQVCKKLDISKRTFFEWKRKGLISCVQIGAIILIRRSDLDKFLNEHTS